MLRLLNVATPPTAASVVVPESVPAAGLVPIATVTLPVNPVTRFPRGSRALTCTAGAIARPAVVVAGCTVNTSWLGAAGGMVNAVLVAGLRLAPVAVRV